jgi:hypothetical protein
MVMNMVGLGFVSGMLVLLARWMTRRHRRGDTDRGFVSQQWIAEYRLSQPSDPPR